LGRLTYDPRIQNMYGDEISPLVAEFCTPDAWEKINVTAARLSNIISENGIPYYVKMDLDGAEPIALKDLLESGIRPQFISAEFTTSWKTLAYLCLMNYDLYQIVPQDSIHQQFHRHPITHISGDMVHYDFQFLSSGPFGEDLPNWWSSFERMSFMLASRKLIYGGGHWYDIHARLGLGSPP
jgi:hypothetical protein